MGEYRIEELTGMQPVSMNTHQIVAPNGEPLMLLDWKHHGHASAIIAELNRLNAEVKDWEAASHLNGERATAAEAEVFSLRAEVERLRGDIYAWIDKYRDRGVMFNQAEAEAAKWKGLYEKAWAECFYLRDKYLDCDERWFDMEDDEAIIESDAHDAARREAGLEPPCQPH